MAIKIYGHPLCPDCIALHASIEANNGKIAFEGHDIKKLRDLHDFLKLRDTAPEFDRLKAIGEIGIPCIITEDGAIIHDWESFFKKQGWIVLEEQGNAKSCSIDGKGC